MDRTWMYNRLTNGFLSNDYTQGVEDFINYACNQPGIFSRDKLRCPCRKCENRRFRTCEEVRLHLYRKGFVEGYYVWIHHGEQYVSTTTGHPSSSTFGDTSSGFNTDVRNNPY